MIQRWIGAFCVFTACTGAGFQAACALRREKRLLWDTKRLLEKMESELSCRVATLPQLCMAAEGCEKTLEEIYQMLSHELQRQTLPDANSCMELVLSRQGNLPASFMNLHRMLGQTLGKFDLQGQLEQIAAVKAACQAELDRVGAQCEGKMKSYRTLGLCAGAALAILLL